MSECYTTLRDVYDEYERNCGDCLNNPDGKPLLSREDIRAIWNTHHLILERSIDPYDSDVFWGHVWSQERVASVDAPDA